MSKRASARGVPIVKGSRNAALFYLRAEIIIEIKSEVGVKWGLEMVFTRSKTAFVTEGVFFSWSEQTISAAMTTRRNTYETEKKCNIR